LLAECSQTAHLVQFFDSTTARAHVSAAGAQGGSIARRSAARAAVSRPKSTSKPQANRAAALARSITPVIPRRENSKQRGRFFPKRLYKLRARIEQTIGKLKRFKRVAMRCKKTDISYSAIISFACGLMLVKSVHTA
jgi:Transposase DDE domain